MSNSDLSTVSTEELLAVLGLPRAESVPQVPASIPALRHPPGVRWMVQEQLGSLIWRVVLQEHKQHLKSQTDFKQSQPKPSSGNVLYWLCTLQC